MYDATLAATANILGPTLAENRQPVARHERTTGGSAFYRLYETADGRHLALGGQEMKFVRNLLGALGRLELAPLCEKPGPHQKPVMDLLEKTFKQKSLQENLAFLSKLDVCYAPVLTLPEALDAAADKLLRDEQGRRHLAPPVHFRTSRRARACASRAWASTTRSKKADRADLVAVEADVAQHAVAHRVELALGAPPGPGPTEEFEDSFHRFRRRPAPARRRTPGSARRRQGSGRPGSRPR